MHYSVKVERQLEDGRRTSIEVGQRNIASCQIAADVGLKLDEVKPLLAPLHEIIVTEQLRRHCDMARKCPSYQVPET